MTGRSSSPEMIRIRAAKSQQRVVILPSCSYQIVLQFPPLVSRHLRMNQVVPLQPDLHAPISQTIIAQVLHRRWHTQAGRQLLPRPKVSDHWPRPGRSWPRTCPALPAPVDAPVRRAAPQVPLRSIEAVIAVSFVSLKDLLGFLRNWLWTPRVATRQTGERRRLQSARPAKLQS